MFTLTLGITNNKKAISLHECQILYNGVVGILILSMILRVQFWGDGLSVCEKHETEKHGRTINCI